MSRHPSAQEPLPGVRLADDGERALYWDEERQRNRNLTVEAIRQRVIEERAAANLPIPTNVFTYTTDDGIAAMTVEVYSGKVVEYDEMTLAGPFFRRDTSDGHLIARSPALRAAD